jgi:hypothetical protein
MKTEYLVIDQSGKRQVVEQICEVFPNIGITIFAQAFIVEAVHLCNLTRFVVATKNSDSGRISDLERDEEGDGLDGIIASINVVT